MQQVNIITNNANLNTYGIHSVGTIPWIVRNEEKYIKIPAFKMVSLLLYLDPIGKT